jgi:hypothetical protein
MVRRVPILFAVVVAGLLASWLFWIRGAATTPIPAEATATPGAPLRTARTPELDSANTATDAAPQRESAASVPTGEVSTKEATSVQDESGATLVVRTIDKVSGRSLSRVHLSVMPRLFHGSFVSKYVDGSKGTLRTAPITAADGRAEFELPVGVALSLSAHGEDEDVGNASREIPPLKPGEHRELTLELPTGDDLHYFGRVLAREDKRPIAGASVKLLGGERWSSQRDSGELKQDSKETLLADHATDPDGLFELWLRSWKYPELRIQAAGYATVLLKVGMEHDTPEKAKVVLLSRSASLRARLLDAGGLSVADGAVRLWTQSYNLGESDHGEVYLPSISESQWMESADPSGLCVLQGLPPDVPFHVEIFRGGHSARTDLPSLSLSPGEVREVEWSIGSGCRLEGSVVDQHGEAVTGRTIWLRRADVDAPTIFQKYQIGHVVIERRTTSDGRFVFPDVSPGKWWIGPAAEHDYHDDADPDGLAPFAQVVEVLDGSSRQELVLKVHRGLYIRGTVLNPAGEPAPHTHLWGQTELATFVLPAQTGADGAFAMGPLVPGRYRLVAQGWEDADSEPVEADGGDEGVVLRLKTGGSIRGTVLDGVTGKGCVAEITYAIRDHSDQGFGMMNSKEDGTFQIGGLNPGTYDLAARASGQRVGVLRGVSVQAGIETRDLILTVAPGARLRVRYAGKEGYLHYRVLSQGTTIAGDGVAAGGSSETAVPSGRLVVECQWPGTASETKEIEVAVGEEKELVFGGGG